VSSLYKFFLFVTTCIVFIVDGIAQSSNVGDINNFATVLDNILLFTECKKCNETNIRERAYILGQSKDILLSQSINLSKFEVKFTENHKDISNCSILIVLNITSSENLKQIHDKNVITVGWSKGDDYPYVINFGTTDNNKYPFVINYQIMLDAGLKIDARLLERVKVVGINR